MMTVLKTISAPLVLSFVAMAANTPPSNGQRSFDGRWVLDRKSSPDASNAPNNLVQQINTNGSEMIIQSKFAQPKDGIYPLLWVGIMTERLQLKTDGTESESAIGPFELRSKTNLDGKTLVTEWTANMENGSAPGQKGGSVQGKWIRTLSDDGRQLTLQIKGKVSDGRTLDATLRFNRK
jgi:hypothetical protein